MPEIKFDTYKDRVQLEAALTAAGVPATTSGAQGRTNFTRVHFDTAPDAATQSLVQDVFDGVGLWTLSAATLGDDRIVTGMTAAYSYTVYLDDEGIDSGNDNVAPLELTIQTDGEAGTYRVEVIATDGTATGSLTFEVV